MQSKWEYIVIGYDACKHDNWFLKHKAHYGQYNKVKIYARILTFTCCFCVAITYIPFIADALGYIGCAIAIIVVVSIPIIIISIVIYKTPQFNDIFRITQESKLHILFILGHCLLFVIMMVSGTIFDINFVGYSIFNLQSILWNGMFVAGTLWIVYKNESNQTPKLNHKYVTTLEDVLRNKFSMQLFVDHLSREYNIELITCYIEVNYFLSKILENNKSINTDGKSIEFFYDELSEVLKKKDENILHMANNKHANITQLHANILYHKYLERCSEYEINISGDLTKKFENIMSSNSSNINININDAELFEIFYDIRKEMHKMLYFSFERYKQSPNFNKIQDVIQSNI